MNNDTKRYKELASYLAGDQSPEESGKLKKKLSANPDTADQLSLFEQVWQMETSDQEVVDRIKAKTKRKISGKHFLGVPTNLIGYAATLLFVLGLSYTLYFWGNHYPLKSIEYASTTAEIESFTLPDGSEVWLNAKSKLSYKQYLWSGNRDVFLEGEAYFKVVSDKKHPFVVETSCALVQVTGTTFSVSAYADDPFINACLEEGSVTFINKDNEKKHPLLPQQKANLTKESNVLNIVDEPNMKVGSWRNGHLNFYDESLGNISRKLERKFDIAIEFADQQLEQLRYTAEFEHESLEQILRFIKLASSLEITQSNNTYIFSLKNNDLPMN